MSNNTAIVMLSSRYQTILNCLKYYNLNHPVPGENKYPLFIYHFDEYNESTKNDVKNFYKGEVSFIQVKYEIPWNISEEDLYCNRKEVLYVKQNFPPERIGYIHMCNFCFSDIFNRPEIKNFKYVIKFDDDSYFSKPLDFNIVDRFKEVKEKSDIFGMCGFKWGKNASQNNIDTRIMLFEFVKYYVNSRKIEIKNKDLRDAIQTNNLLNFHQLGWRSDLTIYEVDSFKDYRWKDWVAAVNDYGGIYKYRWGDCELLELYAMFYFKDGIYDLDLLKSGLYGGTNGHIPGYSNAPGVKKLPFFVKDFKVGIQRN